MGLLVLMMNGNVIMEIAFWLHLFVMVLRIVVMGLMNGQKFVKATIPIVVKMITMMVRTLTGMVKMKEIGYICRAAKYGLMDANYATFQKKRN